jgi:Protein of unknown function (DUF3108)
MLVLGIGVFLAHLVVLQTAPAMLDAPDPASRRAWTTRSIVLNPPAPVPVPQTAQALAPASPPAAAPRPRPLRPTAAAPAAPAAPALAPPAQAAEPAPDANERTVAEAAPSAEAPAAPSSASAAANVAQSTPTPTPTPVPAPAAPTRETSSSILATTFAVPGSVRLKFNATGFARQLNYEANGELLWLHDGANYEARLETRALFLGARVLSSTGQIGAQGLAPTRFGDKSRGERAAHFDRDKARVTFSANTPDAPLLVGAQDRLSVLMQLAAMLAGDPARYRPGATISVQTISARDADTWLFTVEGEEKLRVADAEQNTLKLTRNPRREFDTKVQVWFAAALNYLPVKFRLTESNGDFVDLQLRAIEKP